MKQWRTVLATIAVMALLIIAISVLSARLTWPKSAEREITSRIRQYKLIAEEQRFITEIWTLRYEAAVMQAKFNPVPDANTP